MDLGSVLWMSGVAVLAGMLGLVLGGLVGVGFGLGLAMTAEGLLLEWFDWRERREQRGRS